jgi:hypothetical protein
MRLRRALALLVLGGTLSSCAVGEFIAGAPSNRQRAAANGLLERRCSGCHAVPDPLAMSGAQWQSALRRMERRIQLPASEWDSLAAMGAKD